MLLGYIFLASGQGQKGQEGLPATCLNEVFKQAADSSKFPFFVVLNNKKSKDFFKS